MAIVKQESLDTIISLIQANRKMKEEAQEALEKIDSDLTSLYARARAQLEGTGMDLVLLDNEAGTVVTEKSLDITHISQLKPKDRVKVLVKYNGSGEWEEVVVTGVDGFGFNVTPLLSDESDWVDNDDDQWVFISRP